MPESDDRGNGKESESEVPSKETVTVTVTVTEEVVEEVKADDVELDFASNDLSFRGMFYFIYFLILGWPVMKNLRKKRRLRRKKK